MPLLDGRCGDEFGGGSGAEIVLDVGFQRWLVAFEGEEIIRFVGDDLVGNLDLAAHGVDGDQGTFELAGFSELIDKIRNGGDFVGFFGNAGLCQDQTSGGGVGAQRVQGFETLAMVMGSACCLAVDGNEIMASWPQRRNPARKAAPKQDRIDPVDEAAQPGLARNAVMKLRELP